jgi:D-alanyl-D-alanine dipeptidase
MLTRIIAVLTLSILQTSCTSAPAKVPASLDPDFVSLHEVDPSIIQEIRYATDHNFIGRPIKGYLSPKCMLSRKAALALSQVQKELLTYSLSLKVYDCYRPQRAVNDFVEWAKDLSDLKMKKEFYPGVDKSDLFKDGYIAEKSGHSRGSTVDLTIVSLPLASEAKYNEGVTLKECYLPVQTRFTDNSLDMGTGFDCFDPLAHTANSEIGNAQKKNRLLLKSVMEKFGFKNLAEEWWHFTLRDEPYPDRYFDFEIIGNQ